MRWNLHVHSCTHPSNHGSHLSGISLWIWYIVFTLKPWLQIVMAGKSSLVMGREWVLIVVTTGWKYLLCSTNRWLRRLPHINYLVSPLRANRQWHVDCERGGDHNNDEPHEPLHNVFVRIARISHAMDCGDLGPCSECCEKNHIAYKHMVFSYINTMLAEKSIRVWVCKCVTLYHVFASRHNVNLLAHRNFLSKHICIMHTVLLPFFVRTRKGERTSESLQSTPCHFGTLRSTEGFHVCVCRHAWKASQNEGLCLWIRL